jgi:hypothetical protein
MSIPFNPTIEEYCRDALRKAGQPAPSTTMVNDAAQNEFQEVKNDIKRKAKNHPLLLTNGITVVEKGVRKGPQPSDASAVKSVLLFDAPDDWRGNFQSQPDDTTAVLATDVDAADDDLVGYQMVFNGTGGVNNPKELKWITVWDNVTKLVTVDSAYIATAYPSAGPQYFICDYQDEIYNTEWQVLNYDSYQFVAKGRPERGTINGEEIWFDRPCDKPYPLYWTYYKDLDQFDETDDQFIKILREWRSVFILGLTRKLAIKYDDARADTFIFPYRDALNDLASDTIEIVQTKPYDPSFCTY